MLFFLWFKSFLLPIKKRRCENCMLFKDTGLVQFYVKKGDPTQWEGLCKLNPDSIPKNKQNWCGQWRFKRV